MKSMKRPVHSWKPASPSLLIHSPASSRPVDMTSPAKTTATALPNLSNSCWFPSQTQIKGPTFPVLSHKDASPGTVIARFPIVSLVLRPKIQPNNLRKDGGHTRTRTATGAHLLQKTSEEVPQTTLGGQCQGRYSSRGPRAYVWCHHQDEGLGSGHLPRDRTTLLLSQ